MTARELLQPRYEVIADYPKSDFKVGDVIQCSDDLVNDKDVGAFLRKFKYNFDKYPHLFKKLNWWEYRKLEDMPKRLICKAIKGDTEIQEIEEWDMEILVGWTDKAKRECCSLLSFKPEFGYFPVD